ncbi:MAG: VCBS repeat-containing protein [Oligoflexia bacterium]|nr:VCBS repeat-containing protein [Oligoflexia bacterium]
MTILPLSLLNVILGGCTPTVPLPNSALEAIDEPSPQRVELAGGAGAGTVDMPVMLVNSYGAAVQGNIETGNTVQLAVDTKGFSLEEDTIQLDAEGHGVAHVLSTHTGAFTVRVVASSDGAEIGATATGVTLGADAPTLQLDSVLPRPAELGEAKAMARGTGGLALVGENSVWWVPAAAGSVPWQVLAPPFSILGVRGADVDADGVHDLVVWGEQQVILLRGRSDGGYSWGAGWQSPDMQVVGVSVDDVDGDQIADVIVGQTDQDVARVELLHGDGIWGFTAASPLELDYPIEDLVAADEDSDGRPDVTVLDGVTGWLQRYTHSADRWTGSSPPQLDRYDFPAGSKLLPPSDLNGDGVKDIIAVSGPGSGAQSVIFYVLVDNDKYEQAYATIDADVYDVDQDGAVDLLLMDDGILHRIRYDFTVSGFVVENLDGLAHAGPISVGDLTGDGIADLAVFEDGVVLHQGASSGTGSWSVGSPALQELVNGIRGPVELLDLDGDGDKDIVGVVTQGGGGAVRVWLADHDEAGTPTFTVAGTLELDGTGDVLDMSFCDPDWYFAVDNSAAGAKQPNMGNRVHINADNDFVPEVMNSGGVSGTLVACGYPETKKNRRAAFATTDGHVVVYAYDFSILWEEDIGDLVDIDYADTDGDQIDELYSCDTTDCQILGVDLDGDGTDELVTGGSSVSVSGWGDNFDLDASGIVSVDDLDRDGLNDILIADPDSGRITAIPTLTGALGPPSAWFTTEPITGPVHAADLDQDGTNELVFPTDTLLMGTLRTEAVSAGSTGSTGTR